MNLSLRDNESSSTVSAFSASEFEIEMRAAAGVADATNREIANVIIRIIIGIRGLDSKEHFGYLVVCECAYYA